MQVTDDLKHHIKLGRKLGIHVSPAVVVDGVVEESIESRYLYSSNLLGASPSLVPRPTSDSDQPFRVGVSKIRSGCTVGCGRS